MEAGGQGRIAAVRERGGAGGCEAPPPGPGGREPGGGGRPIRSGPERGALEPARGPRVRPAGPRATTTDLVSGSKRAPERKVETERRRRLEAKAGGARAAGGAAMAVGKNKRMVKGKKGRESVVIVLSTDEKDQTTDDNTVRILVREVDDEAASYALASSWWRHRVQMDPKEEAAKVLRLDPARHPGLLEQLLHQPEELSPQLSSERFSPERPSGQSAITMQAMSPQNAKREL